MHTVLIKLEHLEGYLDSYITKTQQKRLNDDWFIYRDDLDSVELTQENVLGYLQNMINRNNCVLRNKYTIHDITTLADESTAFYPELMYPVLKYITNSIHRHQIGIVSKIAFPKVEIERILCMGRSVSTINDLIIYVE